MSKFTKARQKDKVKYVRRSTMNAKANGKAATGKSKRPKLLDKEPIYISYRLGETINRGNYNSSRLEFGLTVPTTKKLLEGDKKELIKYVDAEMNKLLAKLDNGIGG